MQCACTCLPLCDHPLGSQQGDTHGCTRPGSADCEGGCRLVCCAGWTARAVASIRPGLSGGAGRQQGGVRSWAGGLDER